MRDALDRPPRAWRRLEWVRTSKKVISGGSQEKEGLTRALGGVPWGVAQGAPTLGERGREGEAGSTEGDVPLVQE